MLTYIGSDHRLTLGLLLVLFGLPLVLSAALLPFAHGANDVANAVGPLAAIVHAAEFHGAVAKVAIPLWVMVIGALGIWLVPAHGELGAGIAQATGALLAATALYAVVIATIDRPVRFIIDRAQFVVLMGELLTKSQPRATNCSRLLTSVSPTS